MLLERKTRVRCSSDGPDRVTVREHIESIQVHDDSQHRSAPLVLIDDMLVKGTQTMASVIALRSAGYTGPIEAYFVHQTIAPNPVPLQRLLWLVHRIEWMEGDRLATRSEIGRWRDIDRPTS